MVPIVHVITDDEILARNAFVITAGAIAEVLGPRGALHLRCLRTSAAKLVSIVESLREHGPRRAPLIVINDRVDIALATGAYGVQLGTRSFLVPDVHRIEAEVSVLQDRSPTPQRSPRQSLRMGVSVHLIDDRRAAGADWVIAGHIFATPSHSEQPSRGLEFIEQVARFTHTPVIAIGGIRPEHVEPLVVAGARGVAVVRGIWDAPDPAAAARRYLDEFVRHHPNTATT